MPGIPRRTFPSLRARLREDAGFGLIEVMVSMVMLAALSMATLSLIDRSTDASAQTRSKSLAADIAHDDLNRMRQMKFSLIAGVNYQSVSSQVGVDGVTYKVTSTATWATDSGVETSCTTPTTAGNSSYLRIRSTVSWPSMTGSAVVADSIMAPRGKEANRTTGSLMVKVQDRDAKAVPGASVTVAGQTLVTSAAGCVYFPAVAAGQWPVSITKAASPYNYMDSDGNSPGAATASVVVGDVSTVSVSFDIPAVMNPVKLAYDSGVSGTPQWYTVSAAAQNKAFPSASVMGSTFNVGKVFPFSSGYSFYAGNCAGNSPAAWSNDFTTKATNNSIVAARGQTVSTGLAYMRRLSFTVVNTSTTSTVWNYRIRPYTDATYLQMDDCGDADDYPADAGVTVPGKVGTVNGSTTTSVDVPFGLWSVCVYKGTYNQSTYSYAKLSSTAPNANNAPTDAYNAMPTFTGSSLKAGAPANDTLTPVLTPVAGAKTTDPCPAS